MVSQTLAGSSKGYGLVNEPANILYRRPDHPWLLRTYVWQA